MIHRLTVLASFGSDCANVGLPAVAVTVLDASTGTNIANGARLQRLVAPLERVP
jgi:hypothetical protein